VVSLQERTCTVSRDIKAYKKDSINCISGKRTELKKCPRDTKAVTTVVRRSDNKPSILIMGPGVYSLHILLFPIVPTVFSYTSSSCGVWKVSFPPPPPHTLKQQRKRSGYSHSLRAGWSGDRHCRLPSLLYDGDWVSSQG
jgi:hypothetical protein